jgi:hypothetical protein
MGIAEQRPGSRSGGVSWTEGNRLWLFGGFGYGASSYQGNLKGKEREKSNFKIEWSFANVKDS